MTQLFVCDVPWVTSPPPPPPVGPGFCSMTVTHMFKSLTASVGDSSVRDSGASYLCTNFSLNNIIGQLNKSKCSTLFGLPLTNIFFLYPMNNWQGLVYTEPLHNLPRFLSPALEISLLLSFLIVNLPPPLHSSPHLFTFQCRGSQSLLAPMSLFKIYFIIFSLWRSQIYWSNVYFYS